MPKEDLSSCVRIMSERCKNCLFSPDRLVDAKAASALAKQCGKGDSFFTCHLATYGPNVGDVVACRGFYDAYPGHQSFRIAEFFGDLKFTDEYKEAEITVDIPGIAKRKRNRKKVSKAVKSPNTVV